MDARLEPPVQGGELSVGVQGGIRGLERGEVLTLVLGRV